MLEDSDDQEADLSGLSDDSAMFSSHHLARPNACSSLDQSLKDLSGRLLYKRQVKISSGLRVEYFGTSKSLPIKRTL